MKGIRPKPAVSAEFEGSRWLSLVKSLDGAEAILVKWGRYEEGQLDRIGLPAIPPNGRYPEASFSPYSAGPHSGTPLYLANTTSTFTDWTTHPVMVGSYKGTYDTAQGFAFYRSEIHLKDSLWTAFVLGDLWVNDSSAANFRQVKLHVPVDTANFSSSSQERDSVFCSEWFDVPVGSQVCYFRGMYAPVPLPDTVASTLTDSALSEKFVVQLVHKSGMIDTLETLLFTPGSADPLHPVAPSFIVPKNARTLVNTSGADTVQLRVKAEIAGFADTDTTVSFEMIDAFDRYGATTDTVVAYRKGGAQSLQRDYGHLGVLGPFPNPSGSVSDQIRVLLNIPAGLTGHIEFLDILGRPVTRIPAQLGTGSWRSLRIMTPQIGGSYFLRVQAGNESRSIPVTVVR